MAPSCTIYFLTDARRHKDEEIARDPHVNLSFADAGITSLPGSEPDLNPGQLDMPRGTM